MFSQCLFSVQGLFPCKSDQNRLIAFVSCYHYVTHMIIMWPKEFSCFVCSFHVGSGVEEAEAFSAAVETAAQVFDEGQALGFDFDLLDIGGGFPGHGAAPVTFEEVD